MKFLLYFLLFPILIFSQIKIQGNVYDEKGEPIFGVSVYVDGSTIGTITNDLGFFALELNSETNASLVFRSMGFITTAVNLISYSNPITIILKEDVKELREVVVEKNMFTRKQMMKLFKEQFLGINVAGKNCIIENEEEIYFDYDRKTLTLTAYSDKPLIIINNYLGYKIEYQLIDFQCKFNKFSMDSEFVTQFQFAGNSFFTELLNTKKVFKRRLNSYEGSTLHFFRNLISNNWNKKEFTLYEGSFITNPQLHFKQTQIENGMYKIEVVPKKSINLKTKLVNQFNILFDNKEQSKIQFYTTEFYVDSFGVFTNYENILFSGEIVSKRIGDILPTNFLK